MQQKAATAPEAGWLTRLALVAGAVLVLASPMLAPWDGAALRVVTAFLCVYVAALIHERQRLGRSFRELLEAFDTFNATLYGPDYRVRRRAVGWLVRALSSPAPGVKDKALAQLRVLTGQDLGEDPGAWERWWEANRSTYTPPSLPGEEVGGDGGAEGKS